MATRKRTFQVGERIRQIIASKLSATSDTRLELVTISIVKVTPDLRLAKVYWTVPGDVARRKEVQQAFETSSGQFRHALAKEMDLRFAPELNFYFDDSVDTIEEVSRLFDKVKEHESKIEKSKLSLDSQSTAETKDQAEEI